MTTKNPPTIDGLQFIVRVVEDLPAARTFYIETLGLPVLRESAVFIQFQATSQGTGTFALQQADASTPVGDELWWHTPGVDALHNALAAQGVTILEAPHDMPFGRVLVVTDPAGNAVKFFQTPTAP